MNKLRLITGVFQLQPLPKKVFDEKIIVVFISILKQ